jgi:hypothetical protein
VILSAGDIRDLQKGGLGEVVMDEPPAVGYACWVRSSPRAKPSCRVQVVDVWPLTDGGYAVLLERVADSFQLPERERPERPRLRLRRAQRAKLFAGESPAIEGVGRAPVEEGEVVHLSAMVSLEVLTITFPPRNDGQMAWKLHYRLTDTRDPVRLLRRTPPAHREGDELDIGDSGATAQAAVQSFYTSTPGAAIEDAGEAPDREWVATRTKTQREFDHQRRLARHAEKLRDKSKQKTRRKKAA